MKKKERIIVHISNEIDKRGRDEFAPCTVSGKYLINLKKNMNNCNFNFRNSYKYILI